MNQTHLHEVETIDKALLVVADPRDEWEADANTEELRLLVDSAGLHIVDEMHVRRQHPDPRYYIGAGNADEAYVRVQDSGADVVIVGEDLSPTQQRNVSRTVTVEMIDRTQLILNIFAQRARTSEGKLQVELAQLRYLLPRLTGRGTEMSRIGGGSGGGLATRGPGETKLETDRRRVRDRISVLQDELEDVVKQRSVQNKSRRKLLVPSAALVGYTSAGKSTLLNLLAHTDVEAHARLFATLDPTTRKVDLESQCSILLSDTVGFLRNLPHHLIAAFRATMEEVVDADFLIHVVDASHHFFQQQFRSVLEVLAELGAEDKQTITVFNKSDAIHDQYELRRLVADTPNSCYMSASTGEGKQYLERLICMMVERLMRRIEVVLPYDRGDLLALCHDRGRVISQEYLAEGVRVEVELSPDLAARLNRYSQDRDVQGPGNRTIDASNL
ncbi:MAG: GTPase HflX [Armatimonadetes bacterium]|nr:GTPase HflX [Armatimonadota bacterium]